MKGIGNYIIEKLRLDDNIKISDTSEKMVDYLKNFLSDTLHYTFEEDYNITVDNKKSFYYIYIDWDKKWFDNHSFNLLFKQIDNRLKTKFNTENISSIFTFSDKESRITFKVK